MSERTVRRLETQVLGSAHALEHAIDRRRQHRAILRWRSMPPAKRARLMRARRLAVRAANVAPASGVGRWDAPFRLPIHAIHAAVLPTGKVMLWSYPFQATEGTPRAYESHAWLWDPTRGTGSGAFHEVSPPADEYAPHAMIFCSGGSLLPDGRLLTTGGTLTWSNDENPTWAGIKDVWTFDPWDETWTAQPEMRNGRWYPSQEPLPDGRTLILGGTDELATGNPDLEVFRPSADPHGVGSITLFPAGTRDTGFYPHLFTMPSGQVLLAGPLPADNALLTVSRTGRGGRPVDVFRWAEVPSSSSRTGGTAVLEPGGPGGSTRVTQLGGIDPAARDNATAHTPPRATTETLDLAHAGGGWTSGSPMNVPRSNFNTVLLPDGALVAIGGGNGESDAEGKYATWSDNRSRQVEIRDPTTGAWRLGPAQQEDRAYHSTAVLLPDGRVLSGGDDRPGTRTADTAEIYSPPYLFRGPRPLIGAAPRNIAYGQPFRIGAGSPEVSRAVLMAPGVTTHGEEMQARHVELVITNADPAGVRAVAPPSASVAPPGWYMLFVLSSNGVPSVSRWVHLDRGAQAPQPPSNPGAFGRRTDVTIVGRRLRMHRGSVTIRLVNRNGFSVSAHADLRLRRPGAGPASATALTGNAMLPSHGSAGLRIRLGHRRASLVRRLRHVHATVELLVRDPAGGRRRVSRTVTLVAHGS